MLQLDEDQIKETLKHYQEITQQIHARVLSIRQMMDETNNQLIEIASYPKIDFGKTSTRCGTRKDLLDVYERYQELIEEKEENFAEELRELLVRAESVKRVYLCYQALGNEAYEIVDKLYIKKIPYKAVEAESGLNHRIFEEKRKLAIKEIQRLYESDRSDMQIVRYSNQRSHKKKQTVVEVDGQMSMMDFMNQEKAETESKTGNG